MTDKPIVPRTQAHRDLEQAVDYYAREAGEPLALSFIDAVQSTFRAIAARPAMGSPRLAYELNLPGLRSRRLNRYPFLIFYIEREDHIDVWRVLHAQRDIPGSLQDLAN